MLRAHIFLVSLGARVIRAMCRRRADLVIENLALRQQVTALKKERPRPPLEDTDRAFWVALRKSWPGWASRLLIVNADTLARMVGISGGALTNFEKGRRRISLVWLQKIAGALNTPITYFLEEDRRGKRQIVPGDPREKRLLDAWRVLGNNLRSRSAFLRVIEDLGRRARVRSTRR